MKLLFVMPRFGSPYFWPAGICYAAEAALQAGNNISALNLNHREGSVEDVVDEWIRNFSPDVVYTGGMALHYEAIKRVVKAVGYHIPVRVGGWVAAGEPEAVAADMGCEVVKGLGNWPCPKFVDYGRFFFGGWLKEQSESPVFYPYGIVDEPRPYPVVGSFGCVNRCSFCWHPGSYSYRQVDDIELEIRRAKADWGINVVHFLDDCAAADERRLLAIAAAMKRQKVMWFASVPLRAVSRQIMSTLRDSGCFLLAYGFESHSQPVLDSMRKNIEVSQIEEAYDFTSAAGINVQANFIFGDKAETKATADDTIEWWKKNGQGQIELFLIHPYPQSEIYKTCKDRGQIGNPAKFLKNRVPTAHLNVYNATDNMTMGEMVRLWLRLAWLRARHYPYVRCGKSPAGMRFQCPYCGNEGSVTKPKSWSFGIYVLCRKCRARLILTGGWHRLVASPHLYCVYLWLCRMVNEWRKR